MPYIKQAERQNLDLCISTLLSHLVNAPLGHWTYVFYRLARLIMIRHGYGPSYQGIAEAVGVLETTKLELYRCQAAGYEEMKKEENGDV